MTMSPRFKQTMSYQILLAPALLLYIFFVIVPMVGNVAYSFTNIDFRSREVSFVGVSNFIRLATDVGVRSSILNTLIFTVFATILMNTFGLLLALALDNDLKSVSVLRMVFFLPAVLSPLVVGYLWSYMMATWDYGLLNMVLKSVHLAPVNWLGNGRIALYSIVGIYVWQWSGWVMVIYLANLQTIPLELFEAALMDGARPRQVFWGITLPLLAPAVKINAIVSVIGGLKIYDMIVSTTMGGPGYATETFTLAIIKKGFTEGRYGYGSAIATVLFVFILIITLFQLKYFSKWEDRIA